MKMNFKYCTFARRSRLHEDTQTVRETCREIDIHIPLVVMQAIYSITKKGSWHANC